MVAQPIPGLEAPDWSEAAAAAVDLRTWARQVAQRRGVPEDVLLGVLDHESGLDPKAWGNGGGVGQFIESTARAYGSSQAELRANPRKAVDLAAQLLRDNAETFGGDYEKGAAAYFVGAGNVQQAEREGGGDWLPRLDQIARKYNQGTVSSYLQKTMGADRPSTSAQRPGGAPTGGDYVFPVEGYREKVNLHWGTDKGGADLFAARGTPVRAMNGGRVVSVGSSGLGGNNVTIRGNDGRDYYYAHGDRAPEVKVGQTVPTGQYLFGVGDSGNAKGTGTHLHLGIGNGIISGTGATGGSGRDFDAVGLLSAVLSGSPTPPPSGAEGGASSARAILGQAAPPSAQTPRKPVSEMLADARAAREQDLQELTDIEPVGLPSIRPPRVGDAGLPGLGQDPYDSGTAQGGGVLGSSIGGSFDIPELPPVRRATLGETEELGARWGQTTAPLDPGFSPAPPAAPEELGSRFREPLPQVEPGSAEAFTQPPQRSILDPGAGGEQYTPEGSQYVDPSARGSLRGELEARRKGASQYSAIPERIAEDPVGVASVVAMGLGPSFLAGSGLGTLPGAGLAQQFLGGAIAQPYITEGLNAIPGYENLPGPAKAVAENAPFSVLGKARIPVKIGEAVLGGLGLYGGQKVDEALGGPQLPIVGGFGGLAGGLTGGVGGALLGSRVRPRARLGAEAAPPVQRAPQGQPVGVPATVKPEVSPDAYDYRIFKQDGTVDVVATAIKALLDLRDPVTATLREGFEGGAFDRAMNIVRKGEAYRQEEEATLAAEERSAARQATAPQDPMLGKTPAERRYGERTKQGVMAHGGDREVALVEANLERNGLTWADFGDAQTAFAQPQASWLQEPESPGGVNAFRGDPNNPADVAASMRESVQAVRDERAGQGTRAQMEGATRASRGAPPGAMGIVPGQVRQQRDLPSTQAVRYASDEQISAMAARAGIKGPSLPAIRSRLLEAAERAGETPTMPPSREGNTIDVGETTVRFFNHGYGLDNSRAVEVSVFRHNAERGSMARNPEGSNLADLREVGEVINEFRGKYPDDIVMARPTDDRRARIYEMAGFRKPTANEMMHSPVMDDPRVLVLDEGIDTRPRALRGGGGTPGGAMGIVPGGRRRPARATPEEPPHRVPGRPQDAQSDEAWATRVETARQKAEAGAKHRFWYDNSAEGILGMAHGNVQDADLIARLAAVGSNKISVPGQGQTILQGWQQWKAGEEVTRGAHMGPVSARIDRAMRMSNKDWDDYVVKQIKSGENQKTMNFWLDMMDYIDPERAARVREASGATVTVDAEMMRAFGYTEKYSSPTAAQYRVMAEATMKIARELGWTPKQAQAAIWVRQIIEQGTATEDVASVDYGTAVKAHAGRLRNELIPAPGNPRFEAVNLALRNSPPEAQVSYARDLSSAFKDENGVDVLARETNLPVVGVHGAPLISGTVSQGPARGLANKAQAAQVDLYAAARAQVLGQDEVLWYRPFKLKSAGFHNGVSFEVAREITNADLDVLKNELADLDLMYVNEGNRLSIIKVPTEAEWAARAAASDAVPKDIVQANKEFRERVGQVAEDHFKEYKSNGDAGIMDTFAADGRRFNVNDPEIQAAIRGQPSLRAAIDAVGERVDAADDAFYASYGAQRHPSYRPEPTPAARGGGGVPGAAAGIIGGRGGRPRPPGAGETGAVRMPGSGGWLAGLASGAANEAKGAFSAPIALKSTLSPPLFRQGLARVMTNPAQAFKEFAQSMRVTFNDARAAQIHDGIINDDFIAATAGRDAAAQAAYQERWNRAGPVERSNMKPPTAGAGPHAGHTWQDVEGQILDWREDALEGKSLAELKALADRVGTRYHDKVTAAELGTRLKTDLSPEDLSLMTDSKIGRATARVARSSNRQSSTMINLMRTNWYKEVAAQMEQAGITEVEPYRELRKTIEQFTQRGSWAQPVKLPVFFSTRAMSGRVQQVARAVNATLSPGEVLGGPGAKREAAKAFYAMTAGNLAMLGGIYAAASAAGLNPAIEMDGKLPTLKVGPHRWDPWAGLNTPARAAFGVVADTIDTAREEGIQNAPQGFIQSVDKRTTKLLQGGLSPVAGKINDARKGYDYTGQKYNLFDDFTDLSLDNALVDLTEPFITSALRDAVKEDSPVAAGVLAGPAFLSTGINSYRTPADVADEKARAATGKSLDELEPVQRLKYVDPEDRTSTGPMATAREHFKTSREEAGIVEPEKAPPGETLKQSKAREARNAAISEKNEAVYRRNPELEVMDWYFSGKHGGSLNSAPAVTQALSLNLPEREVRYRGADRNLATSQGKRLWSEARRDIQEFYDPGFIRQHQELAEYHAERRYERSYSQLPPEQKSQIDSDVRSEVREEDPELDALMAYMGFGGNSSTKRYLVHSSAATAPLERLRSRYGREAAKEGWRFALAADAR